MALTLSSFFESTIFLRCVLIAIFAKTCHQVVITESRSSLEENLLCPDDFKLVYPRASEEEFPKGEAKCYRFFSEKTTFKKAAQSCKGINSTLATTKNSATAKGLAHYIVENDMPTRRYWLGLTDQEKEGSLIWLDNDSPLNEEVFAPWIEREPHSGPTVEPGSKGDRDDCVKMNIWVQVASLTSSARWYDVSCHSREAFICEVTPLVPVTIEVEQQSDEDTFQYPTPSEDLGTLVNGPTMSSNKQNNRDIEVDFVTPRNLSNLATNVTFRNKGKENTFPYPWIFISFGETGKNFTKQDLFKENNGTKRCSIECTLMVIKAACSFNDFPEFETTELVLNDNICRTRKNKTHLIVHTALDGCGTVVKNLQGNEVSFQNTLRSVSTNKTTTTTESDETVLTGTEMVVLDCRYPQRQQLIQNFTPDNVNPVSKKTTEDEATFPHVFLLYKEETYDCPFGPDDYPVHIFTSQRLYFEVRLTIPSKQVELHPFTCVATPDKNHLNPNNYILMEKGCVKEPTFNLEPSKDGKISRFNVQASRFVRYFRKVFVHCEMLVCESNSPNNPTCPYLCNTRTRRNIEKNETNGNLFSITSGAIFLLEDEEIDNTESSGEEKGKRQQPHQDEPGEVKKAGLFQSDETSNRNNENTNGGRDSGSKSNTPMTLLFFLLLQSTLYYLLINV